MKELKARILRDGRCFPGGILKVDNFINHQMDPILMKSMAVEFVRRFARKDINKIIGFSYPWPSKIKASLGFSKGKLYCM